MFPILGTTTLICLVVGIFMRLNQPILQVVNYACTPIHIPFIFFAFKWGEKLFGIEHSVLEARGMRRELSILRQEACATCHGRGQLVSAESRCAHCQGTGVVKSARGHMVFTKACDTCGGAGQLVSFGCRTCGGAGVHPRSEVVTLALPPGIEAGTRISVPGRGHAGARGGQAGDLYVTVDVTPHPFLRRDGRDLVMTLPVAVHEAALGARITVPTLDDTVVLRIPAGSASGQRLRLRGRGVPGDPAGAVPDGDLIAELQIVLPPLRS